MIPPDNQTVIKGEIADYVYKGGILYSYSKSVLRTVQNITENIALVKQITGGKKVPLLIFLSPSPVPDKATRRFSTEQLPHVYKAMAMVAKPGLSQLVMKILFRLKPPPIPMRSFTNEAEARQWLLPFIEANR